MKNITPRAWSYMLVDVIAVVFLYIEPSVGALIGASLSVGCTLIYFKYLKKHDQ